MKPFLILILIVLCMSFTPLMYSAQTGSDVQPQNHTAKEHISFESDSVTKHTLTIKGQALSYTATAGYFPVSSDDKKTQVHIFYISYTKDSQQNMAQRPVTFAFNGGPGSSAIWLHLGALGPKRVVLAGDGTAIPKSFELVDNEYTWLDFTDLVFVDPVGTGYSLTEDEVNSRQFYNLNSDAKIMCEFVKRYVTENQRWLSPKYIAGESYGTTRAAAMTDILQNDYAMLINGVILISSALNFETFSFDSGNDLAYALAVPSYAATAWYHKKLTGDLQAILKESVEWTINEYLPALAKANMLEGSQREKIINKLSHFTGLSKSLLEGIGMRVPNYRFLSELLSDSSLDLGRLDSRVTVPHIPDARLFNAGDPSLFVVEGPFVAAFNNYIRDDLNFKTDKTYVFLSDKINSSWTWMQGQQGYVDVSEKLAEAISSNEHLHVFAASGYYDLTTPWLSQQYTLAHLPLNKKLQDNIIYKCYESGHQIYTSASALEKLTQDVSLFFQQE